MSYKNKQIWKKSPLISPKITVLNNYKLVGANIQIKWVLAPTSRIISHKYYAKDLKELREFEAFFDANKGREKSFYIPSHKWDFELIEGASSINSIKIKKANRNFWIYNQTRFLYIPSRNWTSQILDIKIDDDKETFILENKTPNIAKNTILQELIAVRLNSDKFEASKSSAVGYSLQFDFKEVFYE